jgi:hypothetical protein
MAPVPLSSLFSQSKKLKVAAAYGALHCAGLSSITAYRARQLCAFECRLQGVEHWL